MTSDVYSLTSYPAGRGRGNQSVGTPRELLDAVESHWGAITLDVAASEINAVCSTYYTAENDGLLPRNSWATNGAAWCNPPFSMFGKFAKKASETALSGPLVMLATASISTNWWQKYVHEKAAVIPIPRIKFMGHDKLFPKDLCLLIYSLDVPVAYHRRWNFRDQKK